MDLCENRYRIPYSHWRGGPPVWTDEDRAKAIAWRRYEQATCPKCKTRREDWVDEEGHLLDDPTWTVTFDQCHGCQQFHEGEKFLDSKDGRPQGWATTWAVTQEFDPETELTP